MEENDLDKLEKDISYTLFTIHQVVDKLACEIIEDSIFNKHREVIMYLIFSFKNLACYKSPTSLFRIREVRYE